MAFTLGSYQQHTNGLLLLLICGFRKVDTFSDYRVLRISLIEAIDKKMSIINGSLVMGIFEELKDGLQTCHRVAT
jgi:hypothetical protein